MTYQYDFTLPAEFLEQIAVEGFEVLPDLIRIIVNAAMQVERQNYMQAKPYERSSQLWGYANVHKPKKAKTRLASLPPCSLAPLPPCFPSPMLPFFPTPLRSFSQP